MLKKLTNKYSIILSSQSPRRQQFLKDLNIPFKVKTYGIEEVYPKNLKGKEITEYLTVLKSTPFDNVLKENELVITSDTIVWLKDTALEKPKDKADAVLMLKKLSNNTHEVITSVCIKTIKFTKVISDSTIVHFAPLTDEEINYYVDTFQPFDKAGSYGIQEWIGYIGVEKIEGSYFNVMGLPIHKIYQALKNID